LNIQTHEDLMAKIAPYTPQPAPLMFETEEGQSLASANLEFGGWNPAKKQLKPIQIRRIVETRGDSFSWAFDSLAASAEAGKLDDETYLQQLFSGKDDLDNLVNIIRYSEENGPLKDRHLQALVHVTSYSRDELDSYATVATIWDNETRDISW
jgi:hypothetical protein